MASSRPEKAYVWMWLPLAKDPVLAGRADLEGDRVTFRYATAYLNSRESISLLSPDLPLKPGKQEPGQFQRIPGPIADAMPDYWGRQVILNRHLGNDASGRTVDDLSPMDYLLAGGGNRIGALGFSDNPETVTIDQPIATVTELSRAVEAVANNEVISPELSEALFRGSSIGGAWPKALLHDEVRPRIAKFAPRNSMAVTLRYEYVAMKLAALVGIDTAGVELTEVNDSPVLLVDRFDRVGPHRRHMVSCLSTQGYGEDLFRYCTYWEFAHYLRRWSSQGERDVQELFRRIMFNMLVSNTDDHPKNHAVFWDGENADLTPAYDITPQNRAGGEQLQAMPYGENAPRLSNAYQLLEHAETYLTSSKAGSEMLTAMVTTIEENWPLLASEAGMTPNEISAATGRQILNDYTLYRL